MFGCNNNALEEKSNQTAEQTIATACLHCNIRLWANHYSRIDNGGTDVTFKLTADALILRERQGRVMHFTDHDELYFKNLVIDQSVHSKIIALDAAKIASEGQNNDQAVPSAATPVTEDGLKVLNYNLTRFTAENIRLNFKPPNKNTIVLTANYAKMLIDSLLIKFDGNIKINTAKCQLSAETALWSSEHNGLYFSDGYQLNNKTYQTPAFFQISDQGRCIKRPKAFNVSYDDPLENAETIILDNMPWSIRMIFGLIGTPANN